MPRNPFAILGVPLDATSDAIKAAWRRLARENHPDVASGDEGTSLRATRAMAEINTAYQELRDPEKRRIHRAAAIRESRANGTPIPAGAYDADHGDGVDHGDQGDHGPTAGRGAGRRPGGSRPPRPVTGRIDTSALFRPRNAVLHPTEQSPLPGLQPRPRSVEEREPPRASMTSGPTFVRPGPSLESELPMLAEALDLELRFGKWAGFTLGDVAEVEPTYINWIVRTIDHDPELLFASRVVLRELERSGILDRPRPYVANQRG